MMMQPEGKRIKGFLLVVAFCLWPWGQVVQGAEFAEIQQRGQLIVAVKDNVRPMGFREGSGNLQGFEIDIARRLAQELLGSPEAVELVPVENRDRLAVVMSGEVDLAIARVTSTPSRSRVVYFSPPYYLDGAKIITRDPSIRQLSDLAGQAVAVLNASSTIPLLEFRLRQAQLIPVDSYQEAQRLLESGDARAFAADASILTGWVQQYPQYRLLPFQLSTQPLAVVMPKGLQYAQLHSRVNQAIAQWHQEGWLQERAEYWGLPVVEVTPGVSFKTPSLSTQDNQNNQDNQNSRAVESVNLKRHGYLSSASLPLDFVGITRSCCLGCGAPSPQNSPD